MRQRLVTQISGSSDEVAKAPAPVAGGVGPANLGVQFSCPAGSLTGGEQAGSPSEIAKTALHASNERRTKSQQKKPRRQLGQLLR